MAFNILGLMHPPLFNIIQVEPIWADLNGGMHRLPDLADITSHIRSEILKKSDSRHAIARDNTADFKVINGVVSSRPSTSPPVLTSSSISQPCIPLNIVGSLQSPWSY